MVMSEEYSKDRLTRERDQWRDVANRALDQVNEQSQRIKELEAERDRLREALQSAKSLPLPAPKLDNRIHGYVCGFNDGWYAYQQALKEQA